MPSPSVTYTFANSTTADATQVNQNFTDIINGMTDGTKDFSINALTCAGTATFNGNVVLGNASGDDLTITASLASSVSIKTNATYNVGSASLGLASIYFGATNGGNERTVRVMASSSISASYTLTLPVSAGTSGYLVKTDGSGVLSFTNTLDATAGYAIKGTNTNDSAAAGYVGEYVSTSVSSATNFPASGGIGDLGSIELTAGDWDLTYMMVYEDNGASVTRFYIGINTTSGNSFSGLIKGLNYASTNGGAGSGNFPTIQINGYRVSISSTTTYYAKIGGSFTGGPPRYYGRISARRVR